MLGDIKTFIIWLILIFGTVNVVRMVMFLVGSDLYNLRQAFSKKADSENQKKKPLPSFSIIIPVYNEENTLKRCLDSVSALDYPADRLQIIVVDDGSTDGSVSLVNSYNDKLSRKIIIVCQKNAGKAHALNNGMKNYATGELVMCLDADSALNQKALANAASYFEDLRVVALSSNVKIRKTGKFLNLVQAFEYMVCYQMKRAQTVFNIEYIIGGIGSIFRSSALRQVDYYDTDTITEDIDLTLKLLRPGNKANRVIYGADVIAYTESVLDIAGLIRQRYRWKYGRCQTFLKNARLFFSGDKRHNRFLTCFYLPYAIFSDLAFFFEPFMVAYICYVIIRYFDFVTFASAFLVIVVYIVLNILKEETIKGQDKARYSLMAAGMYFFFYILSFVEYVALIKTYCRIKKIAQSIGENKCGWEHVARAKE